MSSVKLIHEAPNIENTIPLSIYQSSSPERFSLEDDDKLVLYAGGTNYCLTILENDPTHITALHPDLMSADLSMVTLYVLNTSFIIWFNSSKFGLELPYQAIVLHALQDDQNLYLQIISNEYINSISKEQTEFISSVELIITKNERPAIHNPLFKGGSSSIEYLYGAMSKCSSFHYDAESDQESSQDYTNESNSLRAQALEVPTSWIDSNSEEQVAFKNVGDADDLEVYDNNGYENEYISEAGMDVDVGFAYTAGSIRKRDDDVKENKKSRRIH